MNVLVTGGGGFLGGAIVRKLIARGDSVRSIARGDSPELRALGVETFRGDLAGGEYLEDAVKGCDLVIHTAAKAGVWGDYREYHLSNVVGTERVIDACREARVPRMVYTSSPSITFAGRDQEGIDESTPYPDRFLSPYPKTKAMAEKIVLEANGEDFQTVALRPHLIWGPGDTQLVPRVLDQGRAGTLRIVGSGESLVDATYIDNAADAHLLAAERLGPGSACAGKAYYISNDEPWPMKRLLNSILAAGGLPPVTRHVSPGLADALGYVLETFYKIAKRADEPRMTRFVARQLATAHWYNIAAAKRDLGYTPAVSMDEGMRRLAATLLAVRSA